MAPEALFGGSRKLLEAARKCWNPLEPAGTAEDHPMRTLRCRPKSGNPVERLIRCHSAIRA
eukprot:11541025-Alexandrium_andersonii.AAC.1